MPKLVDFIDRCQKGEIEALQRTPIDDNEARLLQDEFGNLPPLEQEDARRLLNEVVEKIQQYQLTLLGERDELRQELLRAGQSRDACLLYDRQSSLVKKE